MAEWINKARLGLLLALLHAFYFVVTTVKLHILVRLILSYTVIQSVARSCTCIRTRLGYKLFQWSLEFLFSELFLSFLMIVIVIVIMRILKGIMRILTLPCSAIYCVESIAHTQFLIQKHYGYSLPWQLPWAIKQYSLVH